MVDFRNNNNWTVYVHIVPKELSGYKNDKYYVGVTGRKPEIRWNNGKNYRHLVFKNAIDKYGWNNIKHEIIAENLTKEEAYAFEKTLITLLDSTNRNHGYNISSGGEGGNRKELKAVKQYTTEAIYVNTFSSSADAGRYFNCDRASITRACKNHGISQGYMWCYADEEITQPYKRKNQKAVIQKDLNGNFLNRFKTAQEASDETGVGLSNIRTCIYGYDKTAGGYIWCYE